MQERGRNPDRSTGPPQARLLTEELQRLRKAGLSDLALRPRRYPELTRLVQHKLRDIPGDVIGRLEFNARVFKAALANLPSPNLRDAAAILFHAGSGSTPPPLDHRRRAADKTYTGRSYSREPDTVQRYLERDVLDPMLVEALSRLSPLDDQEDDAPDPRNWDYESWADDLERVAVCLSRQDFRFAATLLERWLGRAEPTYLDDTGLHLRGQSLVLLGNVQRDQGQVVGPLSAEASYTTALRTFKQLHTRRRSAQVELLLAVTVEMSGDPRTAAERYRELSVDERLSALDGTRAHLWLGTALTKLRQPDAAVRAIAEATNRYEVLGEPSEWAVAQQKRALAHLAADELDPALRHIDRALAQGHDESPLQRVRLATAHAHVLLTDDATRASGFAILDHAERMASQYGLAHQRRSIEHIKNQFQGELSRP